MRGPHYCRVLIRHISLCNNYGAEHNEISREYELYIILWPAFFTFRFTSPPTLQKLARDKIKIPVIYFFISDGDIYFSKKYEMTNFSYKACKK